MFRLGLELELGPCLRVGLGWLAELCRLMIRIRIRVRGLGHGPLTDSEDLGHPQVGLIGA